MAETQEIDKIITSKLSNLDEEEKKQLNNYSMD